MSERKRLVGRLAVILIVGALAIPSMLLGLAGLSGRPLSHFLRDPLVVAAEAAALSGGCCTPTMGALSNVGVLLLAGAGASTLFAGAALAAVRPDARRDAVMLIGIGLLTGILSVDDLFLFHETVAPAIGVPEKTVYGTYLVIAALVGLSSFASLLRSPWLLGGAAGCLLAGSVAVDLGPFPQGLAIEDVLKLYGFFLWAAFVILTSFDRLTAALAENSGDRAPKSP